MFLSKLFYNNSDIAVPQIQKYGKLNKFAIMDCFGRVYSEHKIFLPQNFNDNIVFISSKSFQQNHIILSKKIRRFVSDNITTDLVCIGGESYLYGLINKNTKKIIHYTNSESINVDCDYNNQFYTKKVDNNLVNYGECNIVKNNFECVINMSTLNENIIKNVNVSGYRKIIIISCHHDDFWKKTSKLTNYKIGIRQKFICDKLKYFITVTIFYPQFISLGCNCAVAYQLRKRNMRKKAYPFDWCNISLKKLINVLENKFEDYEKLNIKKFSENHKVFGIDSGSFILENLYGIKFSHEISSYEEIFFMKERIKNRIDRFNKLDYVYFVRLEMDNVDDNLYYYLIFLLHKYFDNFYLILVSKQEIKHEKIIWYELPKYEDWRYNNFSWPFLA